MKEKVPLKQKLLQRNQQLSLPVAAVPDLFVQAARCGYLVWHVDRVHIHASLYLLKMKHTAPPGLLRSHTSSSVFKSPSACLLSFLRSQSPWIWVESVKARPGQQKTKHAALVESLWARVDYSVVNSCFLQIWLQNKSLAGLKGKHRCWICWKCSKITLQFNSFLPLNSAATRDAADYSLITPKPCSSSGT